jgi:mRNA interferase MazF
MAAIGRTIWRLPAKSCHSPRSSIYCYSENTFVTALRSNKQVEPRMPTGTILKRGQVWWAFDERIPLVILLADRMADIQAMRVVAPASTSVQGYAIEVPIGVLEGLPDEVAFPRPGYINCHWLVTLTRADLVEYAGALSPEKLSQIEDALRLADLE